MTPQVLAPPQNTHPPTSSAIRLLAHIGMHLPSREIENRCSITSRASRSKKKKKLLDQLLVARMFTSCAVETDTVAPAVTPAIFSKSLRGAVS